jgi:glutamyl-tRNA synthetase
MRVTELVRERIRRLDEFIPATEFFFAGDLDYGPVKAELVAKGRTSKEVATALAELADEYDAMRGPFVATILEPATRAFAEKRGLTTKELFMLLRLVTTGRAASPPLFETMEVLGKEMTRRRMRQVVELLHRLKP